MTDIKIVSGTPDTDKPHILYENVFNKGTLRATNQTTDGLCVYALNDYTNDFWTGATYPAVITVDCGEDVTCNSFGIAAHNGGTKGSWFAVAYSHDDVTYTSAAQYYPDNDDNIMGIFPEISARYWRFNVNAAICSVGVIKVGKALVVPTGVLSGHVGFSHAKTVQLLGNTSIKGQFIGTRSISNGAELDIDFGLVPTAWFDDMATEFETHYNNGGTFFFASNPSAQPKDFGYCRRSSSASEMRPSYEESGTLMQVSLSVEGHIG